MQLCGFDHVRLAVEQECAVSGFKSRLVGIFVRAPAVAPWDGYFAVVEVYRKPYITGVFEVFFVPSVEHGHIQPLFSGYRLNVGALCVERFIGILAGARVSEHCPFAHYGVSHGEFCLVGVPAGAA